jgi:hypothetical protein
MWLSFVLMTTASLCVGFILGWVVGRPRRWGSFEKNPGGPGDPGAASGDDQAGADSFARWR